MGISDRPDVEREPEPAPAAESAFNEVVKTILVALGALACMAAAFGIVAGILMRVGGMI